MTPPPLTLLDAAATKKGDAEHPPTTHLPVLCVSPIPSSTHECVTHGWCTPPAHWFASTAISVVSRINMVRFLQQKEWRWGHMYTGPPTLEPLSSGPPSRASVASPCRHARCCYEDNGTRNVVSLLQWHGHAVS
jgi:hypothetical protein